MVPMVPHIFQKLIPTIPPPPLPSNSINNRTFANLHKDRIDDIKDRIDDSTNKVASEFVERYERRKCCFWEILDLLD